MYDNSTQDILYVHLKTVFKPITIIAKNKLIAT